MIRHLRPGKPNVSAWLLALVARKPRKLAAVALANKTARIVWAMMSRGEAYRRQPVTFARAGDTRSGDDCELSTMRCAYNKFTIDG